MQSPLLSIAHAMKTSLFPPSLGLTLSNKVLTYFPEENVIGDAKLKKTEIQDLIHGRGVKQLNVEIELDIYSDRNKDRDIY